MSGSGPKTEVSGLARHVRFTLRSRHGPRSAERWLADGGKKHVGHPCTALQVKRVQSW